MATKIPTPESYGLTRPDLSPEGKALSLEEELAAYVAANYDPDSGSVPWESGTNGWPKKAAWAECLDLMEAAGWKFQATYRSAGRFIPAPKLPETAEPSC